MKLLWDVLALAGLVSLSTGLWLIWPPLTFVTVGASLLVLGLWGAKAWASRTDS